MFKKVLVANRGAIALRIFRTLRRMGIGSVAVHSTPTRARCSSPPPTRRWRSAARRRRRATSTPIGSSRRSRAPAPRPSIPGYGFLAENAEFAARCERTGIVFIGPTPEQMRAFGLKHTARALATEARLPLLPGTGLLADLAEAQAAASRIGFPVMLKSTAGGGGIGMRRCASADELAAAFDSVVRLGGAHFKDKGVYLEKLVDPARHVEVQIFGDGAGRVLALGQRDCSLQRRNQKVVEETPPPGLSAATRAGLDEAAVRLGAAARYRSAGTVEFVLDPRDQRFYFLEVNTRIQVEHGVTEEVTGLDLIEWMVRLAAGEPLPLDAAPAPRGAAIQARLYAEDPARGFQPSVGVLTEVAFPKAGCASRPASTPAARSPPSTIRCWPRSSRAARRARRRGRGWSRRSAAPASRASRPTAPTCEALDAPAFIAGKVHTGLLATVDYRRPRIEVLDGGTQTTVQDWPGRLGFWDVGVPPSGPMDALSFRLANRLVGNAEGGGRARVHGRRTHAALSHGGRRALTGADMDATLDGAPMPRFRAFEVPAGAVLRMGAVRGRAAAPTWRCAAASTCRPTWAAAPPSRWASSAATAGARCSRATSCTPAGNRRGAVARHRSAASSSRADRGLGDRRHARAARRARLLRRRGHRRRSTRRAGACTTTPAARACASSAPKPRWARTDGGEAGLHPSNIHDNAYAIGTIDFTGDMPVILGPDGPSLGGFVCPATIIEADLWKMGQLKPGDTVRFRRSRWPRRAAVARAGAGDRDAARRRRTADDARARRLAARPSCRAPPPAAIGRPW